MTQPAHGDREGGDREGGGADSAAGDLQAAEPVDDGDIEPVPFESAGVVELPDRYSALRQPHPLRPRAPSPSRAVRRVSGPGSEPSTSISVARYPAAAIAVYLVAVTAISIAIAAALIPLRGTIEAHKNGGLDAGMVAEAFAAVAALVLMARYTENRRAADVGFDRRGLVRQSLSGIGIGSAIAIATLWLLEEAHSYRMVGPHSHFSPWLPLAVCLAYAVAEESIFRGYAFRVIEYRHGSLIALLATAALSTALQTAGGAGSGVPAADRIFGDLLAETSSGLLLGAAYMATRRLWMPIAIQWSWTFFVGPVFGMNLSDMGVVTSAWCHPQIFGSFLRSGSGLGPAASLASCAVWTVAGALMLRRAILSGEWKSVSGRIPKGPARQ